MLFAALAAIHFALLTPSDRLNKSHSKVLVISFAIMNNARALAPVCVP